MATKELGREKWNLKMHSKLEEYAPLTYQEDQNRSEEIRKS